MEQDTDPMVKTLSLPIDVWRRVALNETVTFRASEVVDLTPPVLDGIKYRWVRDVEKRGDEWVTVGRWDMEGGQEPLPWRDTPTTE